MTSFAPPATGIPSVTPSPLSWKFTISLVIAALADWLLYDERLGVSVVVPIP
jgi:hypothetical protein